MSACAPKFQQGHGATTQIYNGTLKKVPALRTDLCIEALMAFGLSGSLSACFMYIFALLCVFTEWQIKMLACLLACLCKLKPEASWRRGMWMNVYDEWSCMTESQFSYYKRWLTLAKMQTVVANGSCFAVLLRQLRRLCFHVYICFVLFVRSFVCLLARLRTNYSTDFHKV